MKWVDLIGIDPDYGKRDPLTITLRNGNVLNVDECLAHARGLIEEGEIENGVEGGLAFALEAALLALKESERS
jgi:hypothetical protein